jgi:hypothetical protein
MVYGDQFWIDFQQNAARKPFLLNPTYFAMRKYGIRSKGSFYKEALNGYRQHWSHMASAREYTPTIEWNADGNRHFTSYRFPHFVSSSLVFAYKSGVDQIPEFVLLGDQGEESRIFRPGFLSSGRVSFSGSHAAWDEFIPDIRWSNRNYSVIRTYEFSTGKVRSLGHKTRYYSPAISKDGSRIAAVEQTVRQKYNLVIMKIDGSLMASVPSPENRFIQHPAWMEGDSALLVTLSGAEGKSLFSYAPASGRWKQLFTAGFDDIAYPLAFGEKIYFNGTFSGIDNIYCLNLNEDKVYQITSAGFGAFDPQISSDGETLLYSNYTPDGYRVATLSLKNALWKPLEESRDHGEQLNYAQTGKEREIITGRFPGICCQKIQQGASSIQLPFLASSLFRLPEP